MSERRVVHIYERTYQRAKESLMELNAQREPHESQVYLGGAIEYYMAIGYRTAHHGKDFDALPPQTRG